jgi:DNA-binding response OmpR family regulator
MNGLILLVEDNKQILSGNARMLKWNSYEVVTALTLREARERISEKTPDAIVLDIMLPDGNGLDFMREYRQNSNIPILLLTGLNTPKDKVRGLTEGGDDYLTKPYDFEELLARIQALLRRAGRVPDVVHKGLFKLDIASSQAFLDGKDLLLSQKEFSLLLFLVQHEGETIKAGLLYEKIWGASMSGDKNAVQVTISKLRKKIEPTGYDINMIRSQGYIFEKQE